jgi:hypothetical protein
MPRALTYGDYFPDFGMVSGWDFYLISELPKNRYMDRISYNTHLKTANGRTSQLWYFDHKSRTIRSRQTTSYSLEISSRNANRGS